MENDAKPPSDRAVQPWRRSVVDGVANLLAMVVIAAAGAMPDSALADGLRYLALGYIGIRLIVRARAGYVRRRPYWTAESWRRYLIACSVPAGALLILVCMLAGLEWRPTMFGAARSATRSAWGAVTVVFMIIGAGGLAVAIESLATGDPTRQLRWPRWLTGWR
jgi:hypothetical protein